MTLKKEVISIEELLNTIQSQEKKLDKNVEEISSLKKENRNYSPLKNTISRNNSNQRIKFI
jgi:hypothetical protein